MLETLDSLTGSHGAENPVAETISRKDVLTAWLAGVIDGEGSIFAQFGKQTNQPQKGYNTLRIRLTISNTHYLVIKKCTEVLLELGVGFNCVAMNGYRTKTPGAKHCATVVIEGKGRMRKLLPFIIPHLTCKKIQAELALELIEYRESLAIHGKESKGRYGKMSLSDDSKIQDYIKRIKDEKRNYPSVFDFSRLPNQIFGESSETSRSPSLKIVKDDDKVRSE